MTNSGHALTSNGARTGHSAFAQAPDCLRNHPEAAEALQRYADSLSQAGDARLRIAACGLYNAGKSSLLNVLVGRFAPGQEAFATGAGRTTTRAAETQGGDAVFIDTPGIDGAQQDDDAAWPGIVGADCLLYAHRLLSAEFEQQETAFLRLLDARLPGLRDRLVLVATRIDEAADDDDAAERHGRLVKGFEAAAGFAPRTVFMVSSKRYAKGVLQGKTALAACSGIPQLQDWARTLAGPQAQAAWQARRQERLASQRLALVAQLQSIADALQREHRQQAQAHAARAAAFDAAADALVCNVRRALDRIDALQ